MTPDQLCAAAQQRHLAGDLATAEALYGRALQQDARHAESLHRLGRLAHARGQTAQAIVRVEQAVALKPRNASYREALGLALRQAGRNEEAASAFRHAVRLDKASFGAHYNLGNALAALGQHEEAAQCFRRAIGIDAKFAGAHNNLGDAMRALSDLPRAAEAYQAAINLAPGVFEFHFNLASVLIKLEREAEAVPLLTRAVELKPNDSVAWTLLGQAHRRAGDFEAAEQAVLKAVALEPNDISLISEIGVLLDLQGRDEESGPYFARALELAPEMSQTHTNVGTWLRDTGNLPGSEARIRTGLELDPKDLWARYQLSLTLLCMGKLREGLEKYESRWAALKIPIRHAGPIWNGEPAPEKTLLVTLEQGHGDMIHFVRYVPHAARRMRVVMEVYPGLRRLLKSVPGIETMFLAGEEAPEHDEFCPIVSLPHVLGLDEAPLPMDAAAPYLRPDPADAAHWAERVATLPGLRVGLVWAGNAGFAHDNIRSVPPALFNALPRDGISFVSLQKDPKETPDLPLTDWTAELKDFADTAALIVNLDLIISVDTAVAHLAGALGKPVWLLNRFDADWRWQRTGENSVWYPTMRQFRQPRMRHWAPVMEEVRVALEERRGKQFFF